MGRHQFQKLYLTKKFNMRKLSLFDRSSVFYHSHLDQHIITILRRNDHGYEVFFTKLGTIVHKAGTLFSYKKRQFK